MSGSFFVSERVLWWTPENHDDLLRTPLRIWVAAELGVVLPMALKKPSILSNVSALFSGASASVRMRSRLCERMLVCTKPLTSS